MASDDADPATHLMRLFAGATRSHGTYSEEDPEVGGKKTIKRTAKTIREPVTVALWRQHLAGTRPLGIVSIREDDNCLWASVDIDVYTLDLSEIVRMLDAAGIPAIVCRTKSGGAHVYMFFSEPVPAAEVVPRLRELAAFLGHGDSEIYPKQTTVLAARGDLGSWLNMPYFGGDKTERYAVRGDGRGMSVETFLARAEAIKMSRRGLVDIVIHKQAAGFETGPPCLESLVSTGFPSGTRNNGILALGVLAKKMQPDNWEALLNQWVATHGGDPVFAATELASIVRSLRKRDYHYKCGDNPLRQRCNVALCRTRPHGVGGGSVSVLESASILCTDPPVFFVILKTGGTVELSASQILSPSEFQHATLVQLREVVPEYSRRDWISWIRPIVENATRIEAPRESGSRGEFEELLEQFATDRHRAERREEVLLGKPWHDEDGGRLYFRLRDLVAALDRARFQCPERGIGLRSWVTARIRDMGGRDTQFNAQGRNVNAWTLDSKRFSWVEIHHELPAHDISPL